MPKKPGARGHGRSVHLGNAGEHLVMAHLLAQGFQAFRADRGNPAFDISVVDGSRHSLLRVKTTRFESAVWSRKITGETFLDRRRRDDYCCIVDLRGGVAAARIYVIPTDVVQDAIDKGRRYWNAGRKKDGTKRVDSRQQRLSITDRTDRHAYEGFQIKWKEYLGDWDRLRGGRRAKPRRANVTA